MASSFRKSLVFGPLRAMAPRSGIGAASEARGVRVPVGPRGVYVGFGPGGFSYQTKADDGPLAPIRPESVVTELQSRFARTNLFKVYLWLCAIVFVFALGASTFARILLVLFVVGSYFVYRWDRDRRTARIFFDVDSHEIIARLLLSNAAGEALARATGVWHVFSSSTSHSRKYNAGASQLVGRAQTRSVKDSLDELDLNIECWSLPVGGRKLVFLPDRLLVRTGVHVTMVPYQTMSVTHSTTRFIEEGSVPRDARVVDMTWRFVNKSGGPDRRFNDNRQLPVAEYGELVLRAANGEEIVIQASNPLATQEAASALRELARVAGEPSPPYPRTGPDFFPSVQSAQNLPEKSPRPFGPIPPAPALSPSPPRHAPSSSPWGQQLRFTPHAQGPSAPRPLPFLRPQARTTALNSHVEARFLGPADTLNVAGRTIQSPLTYTSVEAPAKADASTVITNLPIGDASRAAPLPYWPRYSETDANQRARYLDWMAGGRTDTDIAIGYVFIFFYGLERRVLVVRVRRRR